jgi:hypothetical protein
MREAGYEVVLSTEFEGANPQTAEGVMREGSASWIVLPAQEEDNPNYKFRMDALVVNRADEPREVSLHVDWRTPTYMEVRDHLFFLIDGRWERVQGTVAGTFCIVTAPVPPGETYVSLNPKYSYADHLAALESLRARPELAVRSIGATAGGRDIFLVSAGRGEGRPVVLVEAGNHPYETSGAYCIDGMLDWLLGPGVEWRDRVAVHFLPVSNPDGVAEGWCRLTGPGGVDICHEFGISPDPTCAALRDLMGEIRPLIYLNIHGWMYNDLDNFRYGDRDAARFFLPCLLADVGAPVRRWRIQNSKPEEPPVTNTWYARAHFGSRSLGFDIAWNPRDDSEMRALGASLLEAACEAAVTLAG